MKAMLKSNQGMAMMMVLVIMVILLSITGASLLLSGLNQKTASNLRTGGGAIHAADAGIQHALSVIPSGTTFSYSTDPNSPTSVVSATSFNGYTYTVTAINDSTSPGGNTRAILVSAATGPNNSLRRIRAYIGRSGSSWVPPGAVYIPGEAPYIETRFNGASFQISGRDTNVGGAVGSGSASAIPGITTSDSATTTEISGASGSLASNQYASVTGQGSSPSVSTVSSILDVEQLAQDLSALAVEGVDKQTLSAGTYSNMEWGTSTVPKVTRITGNATLQGDLTGYGVLIVDGDLYTKQSFTWKGVVIVGGNADIHGTSSTDGATVWGALLIKKSTSLDSGEELSLGGPSRIYYSSETINVVLSRWSSAFPKTANLIAWQEVMQ